MVQVPNRRLGQGGLFIVNPADQGFHFLQQLLVLLHPVLSGAGDLHEYRLLRTEEPAVQKGTVGPEPVQDALGVVQPVHPEQNDQRVSQF
jgi:hypothetical protein